MSAMFRRGMLIAILTGGLLAGVATAQEAALRVGATHPLIADIARQIGGDRVEVVDLMPPGADAHHFEPTPQEVVRLKDCAVILASGLGMESYLEKLRDTTGLAVFEVGSKIPAIAYQAGPAAHDHSHDHDHHHDHGDHDHGSHDHGPSDPHWWHSGENVRRALAAVTEEFAKIDPAGKSDYEKNRAAAEKKLASFMTEMKRVLRGVPKEARVLMTSHAAFAYFCQEHGFTFVPVLGLQAEGELSPKQLTAIVDTVRERKIRAVFPEDNSNPKSLAQIAEVTGAKIGKPLSADGTGKDFRTFEAMTRHNVEAIVEALSAPPAPAAP